MLTVNARTAGLQRTCKLPWPADSSRSLCSASVQLGPWLPKSSTPASGAFTPPAPGSPLIWQALLITSWAWIWPLMAANAAGLISSSGPTVNSKSGFILPVPLAGADPGNYQVTVTLSRSE
ncbi:hypothetical protein D3C79_629710 [compost metagenome]